MEADRWYTVVKVVPKCQKLPKSRLKEVDGGLQWKLKKRLKEPFIKEPGPPFLLLALPPCSPYLQSSIFESCPGFLRSRLLMRYCSHFCRGESSAILWPV